MNAETDACPAFDFTEARTAAYRVGRARATHASTARASVTIPVGGDPDGLTYFLAEPARAAGSVPSADVAAMDGFAVAGPAPWSLVGTSLAGDPHRTPRLERGQACIIATGAVVPHGTDGVVRHEDMAGEWPPTGPDVVPLGTPRPGHIRRAGEELEPGTLLGNAGDRVTAALHGLAAAAGLDSLTVRRPPRVAIIATGTELTSSGSAEPGEARDAITPILRRLLPGAGAVTASVEMVPDDAELLAERLVAAARTADVVVTTGMASNGPADHVRGVLARIGAETVVPRVLVRPGGPQTLSVVPHRGLGLPADAAAGEHRDGVPVVSLPGNPLAAVVGFHTLVVPLVRGLVGAALPVLAAATLYDAPQPRPESSLIVPAAVADDGRLVPAGWGGSAQLRGLAGQGLLAVMAPSGLGGSVGGARVDVRLLPGV